MKNPLLIAASAIFLSSCAPPPFFNTPNDFKNINATVYTTRGDTITGRLTVNSLAYLTKAVRLYADDEKRPMRFNMEDKAGYSIGDDFYAYMEVRGVTRLRRGHAFMKRLTPAGSRMNLYENVETVTTATGRNMTFTRNVNRFYVQLPSEDRDAVWLLSSPRFFPNFDEKMSRYLQDCPSLAQKIANKEPGYSYAPVSFIWQNRMEIVLNIDVLLNIIKEYNDCR